MKQCRSGLGEVFNVRSLALKPIMIGLALHESSRSSVKMWIPWLRVVCDNLHRIASMKSALSSRCSSISTMSGVTSSLVQAALPRFMGTHGHHSHRTNGDKDNTSILDNVSARISTMSLNLPNGGNSTACTSTAGSVTSINTLGKVSTGSSGDRTSLDRMSLGNLSNCDYLEAISAIKTSNPNASTRSTCSNGSGTDTIVNEENSNSGSGGCVPELRIFWIMTLVSCDL